MSCIAYRAEQYKLLFALEIAENMDHVLLHAEYRRRIGNESKFGEVWEGRLPILDNDVIPNPVVAIKKTPMKDIDNRIWKKKLDASQFLQMKRNAWMELYFMDKCSRLVRKNICPGFPIVFFHTVQQNVSFTNPRLKDLSFRNTNALVTTMELAAEDIKTWAMRKHSDIEWKSAMFQIFFSILAYQIHLNMIHNDLHWGNILLIPIKTDKTYIRYYYKNKRYTIPFAGFIFMISDFGFVTSYQPKHDMKDIKRIANIPRWMEIHGQRANPFLIEFRNIILQADTMTEALEHLRCYVHHNINDDQVLDEFHIDQGLHIRSSSGFA